MGLLAAVPLTRGAPAKRHGAGDAGYFPSKCSAAVAS